VHTKVTGRLFVVLALLFAWPAVEAGAHDLSHSQSDITVSGATARARVQVDLIGFAGWQWPRRDVVTYDELDARIEEVFGLLKEHLQAASSAALVSTTMARYGLIDNHVLDADILYTFNRPIDDLVVRSTLDRITAADHQHLARVSYEGRSSDALLTAAVPAARFERQASRWRTFSAYARTGAMRVLTGPDYLAFVILVLLAVPSGRSLGTVLIATTTAGLIAAVIGVADAVPFSTRALAMLVPAVVAVSAIANVFGGRLLDQVLLASVFALVQMLLHAAALRGQAFAAGTLALPLLAFSLGLVGAQVLLASLAFPLARRMAPVRVVRPAVSVVVAGLALYWLAQRSVAG
jgi:hypothetical protein